MRGTPQEGLTLNTGCDTHPPFEGAPLEEPTHTQTGVEGFAPSRNRTISELQKTAASYSQPSGHAIPSIIPSVITSRIQHVNAALLADPFSINLKRSVKSDDSRNINWALWGPTEVDKYRECALAQIQQIDHNLSKLSTKWALTFPVDSPARRVNFPLIYFLTVALTYPDKKLASEFSQGLPLVWGNRGM